MNIYTTDTDYYYLRVGNVSYTLNQQNKGVLSALLEDSLIEVEDSFWISSDAELITAFRANPNSITLERINFVNNNGTERRKREKQ